MERVTGIEPVFQPWQGCVLPLNYTRLIATLKLNLESCQAIRFELVWSKWIMMAN